MVKEASDEQRGDTQGEPQVKVESLKTNEEVKFHMPWTATVSDVWAAAYVKLGEEKHPEDEIQCDNGTKLAPHLSLTLEQLRDQKICPNRHFQIRGPTGGA